MKVKNTDQCRQEMVEGEIRSEVSLDDFSTLEEFTETYRHLFSKAQLQWLIKNRRRNGLDTFEAVLQVGRRLYIRKREFTQWFLSQKGGGQ